MKLKRGPRVAQALPGPVGLPPELASGIAFDQVIVLLALVQVVRWSGVRPLTAAKLRFKPVWIELNDYDFSLLAAMIANYVIHHQYGTKPRDAIEVNLLEQVLKEMVAVGPKTGRWSVQRAIDGARLQLAIQLKAAD